MIFSLIFLSPLAANTGENLLASQMTNLVFQVGFLVITAFFLGSIFDRFGLPKVLGEILAGVILGPHLFGAFIFPGFPQGLFPLGEGAIPVSPELYGFATLAAVLLLFNAGLETDLGLFKKYALRGGLIGIFEVVVDFLLGNAITVLVLGVPPWHPSALILGVILTATSVGVTARNLMENRKMDSPEGVTILSTAVFDDVIGIIVLAVMIGVLGSQVSGQVLSFSSIGFVTLKAVGVWLGFTLLGLFLSPWLGKAIKKFKTKGAFTLLGLGMAFILAGIFEKAGLAMIIGAYVMGLTLASTDLGIVIQDNIKRIREFFVPLFFAIMGMMVDPSVFLSPKTLLFGLAFTAVAILGKVIGSGGPALLMGFNLKGALRIGIGMVPRGEVALIVAGIGISSGYLDKELLGIVIMMSLITILFSTTALKKAFSIPGIGTRKIEAEDETQETRIPVNAALREALVNGLLKLVEDEGFFIHRLEISEVRYVFRKEDISFSLLVTEDDFIFRSQPEDITFIKTLIYETMISLQNMTHALKRATQPLELAQDLAHDKARLTLDLSRILNPKLINVDLQGTNKQEILEELIHLLGKSPMVSDLKGLRKAIYARESSMSTGMQEGVALPHGKCPGVKELVVAVGIHHAGVDFGSLDQIPSQIFIALATPENQTGPHLQFLSMAAGILKKPEVRQKLLKAQTAEEVVGILKIMGKQKKKILPSLKRTLKKA